MNDGSSVTYQDLQKEMQKDTVMESSEQPSVLEITFRRIKTMDRPMTTEELFKKINDILKEKGYPIARRTVAKYRQQLNIPVARLRK